MSIFDEGDGGLDDEGKDRQQGLVCLLMDN